MVTSLLRLFYCNFIFIFCVIHMLHAPPTYLIHDLITILLSESAQTVMFLARFLTVPGHVSGGTPGTLTEGFLSPCRKTFKCNFKVGHIISSSPFANHHSVLYCLDFQQHC
jgi:hypothetical protein